MTDPRNIAHDKKVQQEKKHHEEEIAPGADKTPQPGKKTAKNTMPLTSPKCLTTQHRCQHLKSLLIHVLDPD